MCASVESTVVIHLLTSVAGVDVNAVSGGNTFVDVCASVESTLAGVDVDAGRVQAESTHVSDMCVLVSSSWCWC